MDFNYFLLNERLNQMERYVNLIHSAIAEEQERFFASFNDMEENDGESAIEILYDDLIEVRDEFPRMLFSSFLVAWFTFVEHELIKVCNTKDLSVKIKIHDQERFGTGIQRAYVFLKDGANFTIPDKYWQELSKIREIRNKIVHQDGIIKSYPFKPHGKKTIVVNIGDDLDKLTIHLEIDKTLYQYLSENVLIDFEGAIAHISPTFEYSLKLIDFGKSLFSIVYENLGMK